jgi:predicted metal-dependent peptidase
MQKEILARIKSKVDWKSILRYFVKTSQRANKTSTVKRLNKRYAYIHAGKKVERTAKIAVAIDQSGSVGDDMLVKFFSALDSLSKIATFTVIPFDSAVGEKYIYEWKKGQRHKVERVLHGGTCFQSVTDYVNKQGKWDGIVIATDMCAPKPTACNVPRLWATDAACAENPYFATSERIIKVD